MRRLALALAAALAAGCGMEGEAPFAGVRFGDVAPWEDLGPVIFCQGGARIGAPGSDPGGLCDTGRPWKPCANDADCGSR